MVPKTIKCNNCSAEIEIKTWRRIVKCPYCESKFSFNGFEYNNIDWDSSMYSSVRKWTDCPACRSKNMFLSPTKLLWKCPDCGYSISNRVLKRTVLWFCDECEAFLNVQDGFSTKNNSWTCTECGFKNDVSKNNLL